MQQGRPRGLEIATGGLPPFVRRLWPVVPIFAVAFALDMATGQRYSAVWGSIAIVASVVAVVPAVRPALVALGGYGAVWVVFNLGRAFADDAGVGVASRNAVSTWERALFGGTPPSAWMQDRWFDPNRAQPHDVLLSMVHGSFFVVPFVVAALLWWRHRDLFRPYALATAVAFGLGLVGFLLVPTAPPWLSDPADVTRVTHHLLAGSAGVPLSGSGDGEGFRFEPNPLAALPSVHVAATVLVFLAARRVGRLAGLFGGLFALLMTVAVVYLGEHFVLDAVLGWVAAVVGWTVAEFISKLPHGYS